MYSYCVTCKNIDDGKLLCSLEYDGSEDALQLYKELLGPAQAMLSIDDMNGTLTSGQLVDLLVDVDQSNQDDSAKEQNDKAKAEIRSRILESRPDDQFSFTIVISQYYVVVSPNALLEPENAIQLIFNGDIQPMSLPDDALEVEVPEGSSQTPEEMSELQGHVERLKSEIRSLMVEKTDLTEAKSGLESAIDDLENKSELARMIDEFRTEFIAVKKEKDNLARQILDLGDEIMGLKKALLKVKHNDSHE